MSRRRRSGQLLTSPALPVTALNFAWGGQPSYVFGRKASDLMKAIQPDVVVLQASTPNDSAGTAQIIDENVNASVSSLVRQVQNYGGVPVFVSDYYRQKYGCTFATSGQINIRDFNETQLQTGQTTGTLAFLTGPIMLDPNNAE